MTFDELQSAEELLVKVAQKVVNSEQYLDLNLAKPQRHFRMQRQDHWGLPDLHPSKTPYSNANCRRPPLTYFTEE